MFWWWQMYIISIKGLIVLNIHYVVLYNKYSVIHEHECTWILIQKNWKSWCWISKFELEEYSWPTINMGQ